MRNMVHGEKFVDQADADMSPFLKMYYDTTEEFCWGTAWACETLAVKDRAMLALALTASKGQIPAVEQHVRTSLRAGWSRAEIGEILLHVYCYAGCYASLGAFKAADAIFEAMGPEDEAVAGDFAALPEELPVDDETRQWAERIGAGPLEARGLQIRRELFGSRNVADWMERTVDDEFTMMFFHTTHRYCFGTLWARPGLARVRRSMLSLAITAAQNQHGAVRRHVRSCALAGLSKREIGEILVQVYVYAGVYASLGAFQVASEIFAELAKEGFQVPAEPAA